MVKFMELARWPRLSSPPRWERMPGRVGAEADRTVGRGPLGQKFAVLQRLLARRAWSPGLADRLRQSLEELRVQLEAHFHEEEQVWDEGEATVAGRALHLLHAEHPRLCGELEEMARDDLLGEPPCMDCGRWTSFRRRLAEFLEQLQHHEQLEDLLVQEAFVEDMTGSEGQAR